MSFLKIFPRIIILHGHCVSILGRRARCHLSSRHARRRSIDRLGPSHMAGPRAARPREISTSGPDTSRVATVARRARRDTLKFEDITNIHIGAIGATISTQLAQDNPAIIHVLIRRCIPNNAGRHYAARESPVSSSIFMAAR